MDSKTLELIKKLKENKALAEQIMQSGEGQQLVSALTKDDGGAALSRAASNAAQGNTQELSAMLSQMMQRPDMRALMEGINDKMKK